MKKYESPALAVTELESAGILCGSVNGIGDLGFIYDETEKE